MAAAKRSKPGPHFKRQGAGPDGRKIEITLGVEAGEDGDALLVFTFDGIRATGDALSRLFEALGADVAGIRRRVSPQQGATAVREYLE